jgi:SAM-dependent methyltransferase
MFWFDKADRRALFLDKRREASVVETKDGRRREIVVNPERLADFTALPFPDATFALVVFDPPHSFNGKGIMGQLYGTLDEGWREEIRAGFAECFRVLCPLGTLIFKWNEHRVPVSTVLGLTPEKPLFGQRCGTTARTHWIVFMKQNAALCDGEKKV